MGQFQEENVLLSTVPFGYTLNKISRVSKEHPIGDMKSIEQGFFWKSFTEFVHIVEAYKYLLVI